MIKLLIKKMYFLISLLRNNIYYASQIYSYSREFNSSNEAKMSNLLVLGHGLEKGITMPGRRMGFGYDRIRVLLYKVKECIDQVNRIEVQSVLLDLEQYYRIHVDGGFHLPDDIKTGIEHLIPYLNIHDENCFKITATEYFSKNENFAGFAESRHSVRWFSNKDVDNDILVKAIELAQTAPSTCNRQATRVKIIQDKYVKEIICNEIQNGNRGFGHLANKWLLITQELGAWSVKHSNSMYLDAGIFTMNLLYALHYFHICACTLNANLTIDSRKKLRKLCHFSKSEVPCVFIIVGYPSDEFMIAKSRRLKTEDIINII